MTVPFGAAVVVAQLKMTGLEAVFANAGSVATPAADLGAIASAGGAGTARIEQDEGLERTLDRTLRHSRGKRRRAFTAVRVTG